MTTNRSNSILRALHITTQITVTTVAIVINHLRISTNLKRDLDLAHFISIYIVDVAMVVVVAIVVAVVSVMLLTLDNLNILLLLPIFS